MVSTSYGYKEFNFNNCENAGWQAAATLGISFLSEQLFREGFDSKILKTHLFFLGIYPISKLLCNSFGCRSSSFWESKGLKKLSAFMPAILTTGITATALCKIGISEEFWSALTLSATRASEFYVSMALLKKFFSSDTTPPSLSPKEESVSQTPPKICLLVGFSPGGPHNQELRELLENCSFVPNPFTHQR